MWMGIGIAIFSGIGFVLSIITHNYTFFVIGPGLGVAFGLALGQAIENKYKKEGKIRSLTKDEKKTRSNAVIVGIIALLLGLVAFLFVFLTK